jgi:hypothetical protein
MKFSTHSLASTLTRRMLLDRISLPPGAMYRPPTVGRGFTAKDTVEAMTGFLLRAYGDLVQGVRRDDTGRQWIAMSASPQLRKATTVFLKEHNQVFKTSFSAQFKSHRLILSDRKSRTETRRRRGQGTP